MNFCCVRFVGCFVLTETHVVLEHSKFLGNFSFQGVPSSPLSAAESIEIFIVEILKVFDLLIAHVSAEDRWRETQFT